jgi:N-formylglutamate amidohydrolase
MIEIERPATSAMAAVVFDSPHSGSEYPQDFGFAIDLPVLRRMEDAYVERLFGDVIEFGAPLLHARFPRSYIDVNRALEDLDTEMIAGTWPHPVKPSVKSRNGKGLIWRTAQLDGNIYDRKLTVTEVEQRIGRCWRPYRAALESLLDETFARHARVLHINCHSMRSRGHERDPDGIGDRPDVVLGDRDGTTCDPAITDRAAALLRGMGYTVSVNHPYKGMDLIRDYSEPTVRRHSVMIEVNRKLYMDETSVTLHDGFDQLRADIAAWARALIAEFGDMR